MLAPTGNGAPRSTADTVRDRGRAAIRKAHPVDERPISGKPEDPRPLGAGLRPAPSPFRPRRTRNPSAASRLDPSAVLVEAGGDAERAREAQAEGLDGEPWITRGEDAAQRCVRRPEVGRAQRARHARAGAHARRRSRSTSSSCDRSRRRRGGARHRLRRRGGGADPTLASDACSSCSDSTGGAPSRARAIARAAETPAESVVRQGTPCATAARRISQPSVRAPEPVGVLTTMSTSPRTIQSTTCGEPSPILFSVSTGIPIRAIASAVPRVATIRKPRSCSVWAIANALGLVGVGHRDERRAGCRAVAHRRPLAPSRTRPGSRARCP